MNAISFVADTLNYFIFGLGKALHYILQLNSTIFTLIISALATLKGRVYESVLFVLEAFECCYQDFVIFLWEVISIIRFISSAVFIFLSKTYFNISYITCLILNTMNSIYLNIADFLNFMGCLLVQSRHNICYLIKLFFNSVLLILQALPNFLILLFEFSKYFIYCIYVNLKYYVWSAIQDIFYIYSKSGEAIFSIPLKAYLGALLFILMFYHYKNVINFLKTYIMFICIFLKNFGLQTHYCICSGLKPAVNVSLYVCKKLLSLFYSAEVQEDTDVFYDASSNGFSVQKHRMSHLRKVLFTFFVGLKKLFNRYPFISRAKVEEEIEKLHKELMAEKEKHLCIICYERPRNVILHPCRHMCICEECCLALQMESQGCPLCRHNIFNICHVYT